jgi:hypothetical protein
MGLALGTDGIISGIPTTTGGYNFTVQVMDSGAPNAFDTQTLCIEILASGGSAIVTTTEPSDTDVAQALAGTGVTVSDVTFTGSVSARGTFTGGGGVIGFESGIVLSSGSVASVSGPNNTSSASDGFGLPGDAQLDDLVDGSTFDAAVLQFTFVPEGNQVEFEYVFGSDEYNEFANSNFNDVFGFFINGVNYALVPGTQTPVAINSVNTVFNPLFYRNNEPQPGTVNIQADGLTVVIKLTAPVVAGQSNTMKLAIADRGDSIYNSWVLIKGESLQVVENCSDGIDNDGDTLVDGDDPDCVSCAPPEVGGFDAANLAAGSMPWAPWLRNAPVADLRRMCRR